MIERTEVAGVRMTVREKKCLEGAARNAGLTLSDYMRAGSMLMAMMDGNKEALAITADLTGSAFAEMVSTMKVSLRSAMKRAPLERRAT